MYLYIIWKAGLQKVKLPCPSRGYLQMLQDSTRRLRETAPVLPAVISKQLVAKGLLSTLKRRLWTSEGEGMSHTPPLLPALSSKREGSSRAGQEAQESPGEGQVGDAARAFNGPKACLLRSLLRYWNLPSAKAQDHLESKDVDFNLKIKGQWESSLH